MRPSSGRDMDHWLRQSSNMMMLRTVDSIWTNHETHGSQTQHLNKPRDTRIINTATEQTTRHTDHQHSNWTNHETHGSSTQQLNKPRDTRITNTGTVQTTRHTGHRTQQLNKPRDTRVINTATEQTTRHTDHQHSNWTNHETHGSQTLQPYRDTVVCLTCINWKQRLSPLSTTLNLFAITA